MVMMMVMVMVMVMVPWWWWCHDGDGDGDDDPCKNALTAPEPLLASVHSFNNISTILVLKNT